MEGFLCPISSVRGHVPRVLTLVTSLTSSLPEDLGPGIFITNPHPSFPSPQMLLSQWRKTKPLDPSRLAVHVLIGCLSIHSYMRTNLYIFALNTLLSTIIKHDKHKHGFICT